MALPKFAFGFSWSVTIVSSFVAASVAAAEPQISWEKKGDQVAVKSGDATRTISLDELKSVFKAALSAPGYDYLIVEKAGFKKGQLCNFDDFKPVKEAALGSLDRLASFARAYGLGKEKPILANHRVAQKAPALSGRDDAVLAADIDSLNHDVDRIVDEAFDAAGAKTLSAGSRDWNGYELFRAVLAKPGYEGPFVKIPTGSFVMGSPATDPFRYPDEQTHEVEIRNGFEMQATEVTQAQFYSVMGYNPAFFSQEKFCRSSFTRSLGTGVCRDLPVERVSWKDAQLFLNRLNAADPAHHYRLPTEEEWEYSARGGTTTPFYFGADPAGLQSNAWFFKNSDAHSHKVGTKAANPFGLHDMYGNEWEWTADSYPVVSASAGNKVSFEERRIFRGGSWHCMPASLRSAARRAAAPTFRSSMIGLRVVREAAQ